MKPLQLIISGWGPYADETQVDFSGFENKGLFLITGPTGGGKTTIFDAISFALYGDVSGKNRDKTSVRSDFAKPDTDTFVELNFSHKGVSYRIRRSPKYLRPKKRGEGYTISNETAELYVEEDKPIAAVTEVNRALEQIMGINYEQFKQIAMIAQGEFLELLVANSRDRVEIFRNLFHTEDYEKLQRYLTSQSKQLLERIKTLRDKMQESIGALEVEGDQELEELIEVEDYQYEKIFAFVKQRIAKDKISVKGLEDQILYKENTAKEILLKIKDGEYQNQKIHQLREIGNALEQLALQEKLIEQTRESLKVSDLAQKASGEEKIYKNLISRLTVMQSSLDELKKMVDEQEPGLLEAQLQQAGNERRLLQLEEWKEREKTLESVIPLLKEFDEIVKKRQNTNVQCEQIKEKENKLNMALMAIKEELCILQDEYMSYQEVDIKKGKLNLEIEKLRQVRESLEKAKEQCLFGQTEKQKLAQFQAEYLKAELFWKDKRNHYEEKETIYKNAVVGVVARLLEEGKPCPVCGSKEHPKIAPVRKSVPDEHELEQLKDDCTKAETLKNQSYEKTFIQKGLVDNIEVEWDKVNRDLNIKEKEFSSITKALSERLEQEKQKLSDLEEQGILLGKQMLRKQQIEQVVAQLEDKTTSYQAQTEQAVKEYQQIKSEYDRLTGIVSQMEERLPREKQTLAEVAEELSQVKQQKGKLINQINQIEANYSQLKELAQKNQTLLAKNKEDRDKLIREVEEEKSIFQAKLQTLGFANEEEYYKAFLEEVEYARRKNMVKDYEREIQVKTEQKIELDKEVGGKEEINLSFLQVTLSDTEDQKAVIQKEKENITTRIQVNHKALLSMREKWNMKEELEEEYGILKDLDDITKGNNPERVVFEHYVLSVYFEEVIRTANYRLSNMTGGRYELEKVSRVADARTKDSLDLEVLDNYTGKKRSVKTLSGGESFKAALSLALGLSDIVQNNAGGIQIDTLFIDEGFGSLDGESLDQALNTLMMLTEHNRLIGIISHVNELKERIDNQVVIVKNNNGSTLRVKTL